MKRSVILNNIKEKYEDHHNVNYTPEAINACVKLTARYITDKPPCRTRPSTRWTRPPAAHISNIIVVPKTILDVEAKDRGR